MIVFKAKIRRTVTSLVCLKSIALNRLTKALNIAATVGMMQLQDLDTAVDLVNPVKVYVEAVIFIESLLPMNAKLNSNS